MSGKVLVVLALLLLAAAADFLWRGRPALAAAAQAHADLLRREQAVAVLDAALPMHVGAELRTVLGERDTQAALALLRLDALRTRTREERAPSLEEALAASQDPALAPEARVGQAVRAAAQASPAAARALALVVQALGDARGVEALDLANDGLPVPLPGVPALRQVQGQLALTASLPQALAVLERLAPAQGAGLPQVGVSTASLKRIEPERWGVGLHLMATPPVRLQLAFAVLLPATEGAGP